MTALSERHTTLWDIGHLLWGQGVCPATLDEYDHHNNLPLTAPQRARFADALVHVPPALHQGSLKHALTAQRPQSSWKAWLTAKRAQHTLNKDLYVRLYRAALQDQSVRSMLLCHLLDPRPMTPSSDSVGRIVQYLNEKKLGNDDQVVAPRHRP